MIATVLIVYFLFQLLLGYVVSRSIKSESDYLIAGRRLGPWLASFSIFATWFGAETCIGAAGSIYENGLSGGTADPFGYAFCILLMGLLLAVPLWRKKLITLADLFKMSYGPKVEKLATLIMIPTSILWAAAQIRAFGMVLSSLSGLDIGWMITMAAGIVILYTFLGGLLADSYTDLIQGLILIVGLVLLLAFFIQVEGISIFTEIPIERLSLIDPTDRSFLHALESWSVPIIGSLASAELITRAIASKSEYVARNSAFRAFAIYLSIGMIPVAIGVVGPQIFPDLETPEQLLPMIAQKYLPEILYALFVGALMSAILSTVDSALLVSGSLISHNVILAIFYDHDASETIKLRIARISVIFFGISAYILALYADGVYALVEEASAFGSAGIVVCIIFAAYGKFGGPIAASCTLLIGITTYIIFAYFITMNFPFIISLVSSILSYVIIGYMEKTKKFQLVLDSFGNKA